MRVSGNGAVRLIERMSAQRSLSQFVGDDAGIHKVIANGGLSSADFVSADRVELRRSEVRYLAALFPDASLGELTDVIYDIIDNDNITRADLRMMLAGYSMHDASKRLNDTPIEVVQSVGRMLREGRGRTEISRTIRVSEDTVYRIDRFLGLSDAYRARLLDSAIQAVRDGVSTRVWAKQAGLSKSVAGRLMKQGREVLVELGEL
jgi:predicted transcriptional regulator